MELSRVIHCSLPIRKRGVKGGKVKRMNVRIGVLLVMVAVLTTTAASAAASIEITSPSESGWCNNVANDLYISGIVEAIPENATIAAFFKSGNYWYPGIPIVLAPITEDGNWSYYFLLDPANITGPEIEIRAIVLDATISIENRGYSEEELNPFAIASDQITCKRCESIPTATIEITSPSGDWCNNVANDLYISGIVEAIPENATIAAFFKSGNYWYPGIPIVLAPITEDGNWSYYFLLDPANITGPEIEIRAIVLDATISIENRGYSEEELNPFAIASDQITCKRCESRVSSSEELMNAMRTVRMGEGFNPFEEFDIVTEKEICGIPAQYMEKEFTPCRKLGMTVLATKTALGREQKRIVIIQSGSSTKGEFLADGCKSVAVYHAKEGYIVVLIDRSATFITNDTDCNDEPWKWETEIEDNAYATVMARAIAVYLSDGPVTLEKMADIIVIVRGHSLGGTLGLDCDASNYSNNPVIGLDGLIIVDAPVPFDPVHADLIQRQYEYYLQVKQLQEAGAVYNNESEMQIGVTYWAQQNPYGEDLVPGVPNLILWRDMVTHTYTYDPYAPTPEYCILTGDISGLTHANETRVMEVVLSHCTPYYPWTHVERLTGLMGNVPEHEIDSRDVDSPVLGIGFPGGMGAYSSHWVLEVLGKENQNVSFFAFGRPGHAGDLNERASEHWKVERDFISTIKPTLLKRGDVNLDGEITTDDVVIILQMAADGKYDSVGDVNGDGRVTSLDALMIQQSISQGS